MENQEFREIMRALTSKRTKKIDLEAVKRLTDDKKDGIVKVIVENKAPVLKDFIGPATDPTYLPSVGYTETYTSSGFSFIGTPAQFDHFADKKSRKAKKKAA